MESVLNIITNKDNVNTVTEEQINFLKELIDYAHNNINCDTVLNNKREAWWLDFYKKNI